jgi:hypothetical protein
MQAKQQSPSLVHLDSSQKNKEITMRFTNEIDDFTFKKLAESFRGVMEEMQASVDHNFRKTNDKIQVVQNTVKSKYISPEDLGALQSLVEKKAKTYVERQNGIQLNIDTVLSSFETEFKKLFRRQVGKVKQRIWIDLNKQCLNRKGTDPKNKVRDISVEKAFDFVRRWGGFQI